MANTFQPQQHKGSPRYRSRDSLGTGDTREQGKDKHIHRHTEKLGLGDRSCSSSEAQCVLYSWIKRWDYYIAINKESGGVV